MDDIDGSFERGPFHRASRGQRLGHIRALAHPPIPATTGPSSEWRHGAWREEQIKRYAADPAHNSDPTDISTAKPAPLDTSQPPAVYPTVSDDLVMRATMMSTALRLAAAPGLIDPSDPDDLTKVPPVEV
jgi:hypothetical protein